MLLLVACGGASTGDSGTDTTVDAPATTSETTTTTSEPATTLEPPTADLPEGELPDGPSALRDRDNPEFPPALVPISEIRSGGPPPDGIPSIDDPKFRSIEEADTSLTDDEPVVALEIDGDARAYPIEIMIWHEIVNDTVADVPVTVTYCPLCNSAISYERTINGVETTFGTSGSLFASALVMYDRATESLWTHFDGKAVVGVLAGERLTPVPSPLLSWGDFKEAYPDGQVLSRDTGFNRNYGQNPYFGYDNPDTSPFLFRGDVDERARAKQRVAGVSIGDDSVAFSIEAISGGDAKATNTEVSDHPVVLFWSAGQSSALEGANTDDGRDVGSVGVFDPRVDGDLLTFEADGDAFVDEQTGSTWDITGRATGGELEGTQLEKIPHLDTFWFAWSTYQPGTTLVEA